MWEEGYLSTNGGQSVKYQVKHYEERSQFGIDGGRISKLLMLADGQVVASYDRGWQIQLDDKLEDVKEIYRMLLARWN